MAASARISRPQIFAGHYRGEDFNLVPDVGSSQEKVTKEVFVPARGSLEMAQIHRRHARTPHEDAVHANCFSELLLLPDTCGGQIYVASMMNVIETNQSHQPTDHRGWPDNRLREPGSGAIMG